MAYRPVLRREGKIEEEADPRAKASIEEPGLRPVNEVDFGRQEEGEVRANGGAKSGPAPMMP